MSPITKSICPYVLYTTVPFDMTTSSTYLYIQKGNADQKNLRPPDWGLRDQGFHQSQGQNVEKPLRTTFLFNCYAISLEYCTHVFDFTNGYLLRGSPTIFQAKCTLYLLINGAIQ